MNLPTYPPLPSTEGSIKLDQAGVGVPNVQEGLGVVAVIGAAVIVGFLLRSRFSARARTAQATATRNATVIGTPVDISMTTSADEYGDGRWELNDAALAAAAASPKRGV